MNRKEKEATVEELREKFKGAQAAVLTEYRGLTVTQANKLRRALGEEAATYRVVKNTLARRAVAGTDLEALKEDFTGPISLTLAFRDPATTAKVLTEFRKANPALIIRSGVLEGKLLSAEEVEALSRLPTREQLLGQLVCVLAGPIRGLVGVLSAVPRSLVQVLQATVAKKTA